MIILNSPSNPTGVCYSEEEIKAVAELADKKGIALVSDEIYSTFVYDQPHVSPAKFNPNTIVIDGFSKTYAMTGLRVGYVHCPKHLLQTMLKIQQYTFVCAPQPAQWAGAVAVDFDMTPYVDRYRAKRDRFVEGLSNHYEIVRDFNGKAKRNLDLEVSAQSKLILQRITEAVQVYALAEKYDMVIETGGHTTRNLPLFLHLDNAEDITDSQSNG